MKMNTTQNEILFTVTDVEAVPQKSPETIISLQFW